MRMMHALIGSGKHALIGSGKHALIRACSHPSCMHLEAMWWVGLRSGPLPSCVPGRRVVLLYHWRSWQLHCTAIIEYDYYEC